MARYLVTGAAGFIGSHLVQRLLTEGEDVVGFDRLPSVSRSQKDGAGSSEPIKGLNWYQADLLTADLSPLLDGVDYVIHLAGRPGVRESWSDFSAYSRGNIETTQRLLEGLRGKSVRKVVLASTSSVYGDAPMPAREEGPALPVSPYGVTKLAAETLCALYGRAAAIPWVALRYFTVYGPGQRPDMAFARWLRAVDAGEPVPVFGQGDQVRDFTYVDDAVEATLRAARSEAVGMAINVGGGSRVPISEAMRLIGEISGHTVHVHRLPAAPGDMPVTCADTDRLWRELDYVPTTPLADGMSRQYQAMGGGGSRQ